MTTTVLIVDDEEFILTLVRKALKPDGYRFLTAATGEEALRRAAEEPVDIALVDLNMPGMTGLELLGHLQEDHRSVSSVILTAHGDLAAADEAMQRGAVGFVSKPFDPQDLRRRVARLAEVKELQHRHGELKAALAPERPLVARDPAMVEVMRAVERVAADDATVLIQGESGTGKELVARAIHQAGPRRAEPFLPVDCAAISRNVIESELFGHVRGAFTGADADRLGLLRLAGSGTAFLDEIAELPVELQPKLLRAIQERQVRPVGGSDYARFEARIVCATNRDLPTRVRSGDFREDLYYRINVVTITLPPLRERPADIDMLAAHFIETINRRKGSAKRLGEEALSRLRGYAWPGNVRELENTMECAMVMADGPEILPAHLPPGVRGGANVLPVGQSLDDWIRRGVHEALRATEGNVSKAARRLGIAKTTLYRHLRTFGLDPDSFSP